MRTFFGAAGAEPRLVTLYVTLRVAALPAGGGFMAEQLHAAEAMRSLFPDVRAGRLWIPVPVRRASELSVQMTRRNRRLAGITP